jgi:hypothetical protein
LAVSFFAKSSGVTGDCRPLRAPQLADEGSAEVLREQFGYLLEHAKICTSHCRDCTRFRRIAEVLMEPFQSEEHRVKATRSAPGA